MLFYIYNEFAFAFTSPHGAVTSSVLNTAKRVIVVVSSFVFKEVMERNTHWIRYRHLWNLAYSLAAKGSAR
jgi:uncharacterized membrane protein